MKKFELKAITAKGEDSSLQFKKDIRNVDALASEMVAFSNSEGGRILIGVTDAGELSGIPRADVGRINQLISNAASQHVRSPISPMTENVAVGKGRIVIVVTVPKGIDKPYFDRKGIIWLKSGSDKRRVNSKEELRRLFQMSDQFHADGLPVKAKIEALDKLRFRDFLKKGYNLDIPDAPEELRKLLQNMNLATDDGRLNLAGTLLFAERPEWITPQFILKAVRYPGNEIHGTEYLDSEDFTGSLRKIFDDSLAFVLRNLHKIQAGRGVNAPGVPEIPPLVFEELLVNALVHRDYLVSAPIRLFIFDNRIEIVSPGHLPDNLTVEKIRTGNSIIRNPILVSYIAKGLLPYKGLGSGIKRALEAWPEIDFFDDRDGCLFTATVHRKAEISSGKMDVPSISLGKTSGKTSEKTSEKILTALKQNGNLTIHELASLIGVTERSIERNIKKLQEQSRLSRVGPAKGGHWEVRWIALITSQLHEDAWWQAALGQEDLAWELGVSYATVNRWENWLSKPSKLARVQLDAFCERIQKEGFLVLPPEQDSIWSDGLRRRIPLIKRKLGMMKKGLTSMAIKPIKKLKGIVSWPKTEPPIRIAFFDDHIEIENPGILLPGMTIDDMRQGVSKIRNHVLARVFRELNLIEQWGSGIPRIIREAKELGLPELQIMEIGMRLRFTVTLAEQITVQKATEQVTE